MDVGVREVHPVQVDRLVEHVGGPDGLDTVSLHARQLRVALPHVRDAARQVKRPGGSPAELDDRRETCGQTGRGTNELGRCGRRVQRRDALGAWADVVMRGRSPEGKRVGGEPGPGLRGGIDLRVPVHGLTRRRHDAQRRCQACVGPHRHEPAAILKVSGEHLLLLFGQGCLGEDHEPDARQRLRPQVRQLGEVETGDAFGPQDLAQVGTEGVAGRARRGATAHGVHDQEDWRRP